MNDDDRLEPHAISTLLAHARERRLEFAYAKMHQVLPDGSESDLGGFPPECYQVGLQASVYHAGLAFMEMELTHALFGVPNDWGLIRRMWIAGVRIGFLDAVVTIYYPSMRGVDEPALQFESPSLAGQAAAAEVIASATAALEAHVTALAAENERYAADNAQVRAGNAELEAQAAYLRSRMATVEAESAELAAQLASLRRYFEAVVSSKRWRWMAPLGRVAAEARRLARPRR